MRRTVLIAAAVLMAVGGVAAEPVKAMLIVQNHVGPAFAQPLSSLAARLSAALAGGGFEIIDPGDRVGVNQNRLAQGEFLPASSATRLAENLGATALITASVDDVSDEAVAAGRVWRKRATLTLQMKRLPDGAAVVGEEVTVMSRNYTPTEFKANARAVYSDLVAHISRSAADLLKAKAAGIVFAKPSAAGMVTVGFGCNYPGADIAIDGISRGTAGTVGQPPLRVRVAPGIHRLTVTYPFAAPYDVEAEFAEGSTFLISLQETAVGRQRRQQDAYFGELLDRAHKAGATDDFCRTERARGYAKFMASSHSRIVGMPQTLTQNIWTAPAPVPGPVALPVPAPTEVMK